TRTDLTKKCNLSKFIFFSTYAQFIKKKQSKTLAYLLAGFRSRCLWQVAFAEADWSEFVDTSAVSYSTVFVQSWNIGHYYRILITRPHNERLEDAAAGLQLHG
ncbi:hypothetical protein PENTCL1PPCAC_15059, partial [Pristionchus entomophagus]